MSHNSPDEFKPDFTRTLKKDFDIRGSSYFFTYPRCPMPKEEALKMFLTRFNLKKCVVAQEFHKLPDSDGIQTHLHVYLKFEERIRFKSFTMLDLVHEGKTYHGNYKIAKFIPGLMRYITKSDKNPALHNCDPVNEQRAREQHRRNIGKRLMDPTVNLHDVV